MNNHVPLTPENCDLPVLEWRLRALTSKGI
jgi:hypothetical protein